MKSKIISSLIIVVAIVLAIVFWRGGDKVPERLSNTFPYSSKSEVSGGSPSSPIQGTLTLIEKPLLEKPVSLVLTFKSVTPAPNTEAKIELPDSFELVSGTSTWSGNLEANEEQKIEVVIKTKKVGYYRLTGSAISRQGENYFGNTAVIDIEITPDDAIVGSKPKNNWGYTPAQAQALPGAQNNNVIESQLLISNTPELNKKFTVIYRATPKIDLPDPERTYFRLVFPPKAVEIISVEFPEGGETYRRESGLTWKGSIEKNKTVEITAALKVVNTGWGTVYGNLSVQAGSGISELIQDVKLAELYVDKYGGNFTLK